MLKRFLFLLAAVFLIYLGVATLFLDFQFVGRVGEIIGSFNRKYFGYIAFFYPFALLVPLWYFYKSRKADKEQILAIFLGFFAILLLQALIVHSPKNGALANAIVKTLSPYIGLAGVWLVLLLLLGILYMSVGSKLLNQYRNKIDKERLVIHEEKEATHDPKTQIVKEKSIYTNKAQEEKKSPSVKLVKNDLAQQKELKTTKVLQKPSVPKTESKSIVEDEPQKTTIKPQKSQSTQSMPLIRDEKKSEIKIVKELEENKKLLASIEKGSVEKPTDFQLPPINFLQRPQKKRNEIDEAIIDNKVVELLQKLKQFKIEGDVVRTYSGPLVTTFEFKPAPHVKVSKILNLADDLAMALKAQTIRIQAPIPGKDVVGIEIPNEEFETIYLREIIESDIFQKAASPLTLALGKDIVGKPFVTDLKKLPHLLIAGTTGSGKSVGINAMVISLLYRNAPDKLKLMMIDPKMLEFSIYNDIPHLLTPVITSSKQAVVALSNMVAEMERRYQLMSQMKTKNIEGYNKKAKKEGLSEMPYIVVIIDELADLMMTSGKDVEYSIARLAQMARASGIHLIVATQRPSVDVVTGLIKANLPARISFRVGQKIDSKVILDTQGAESLLGRGDMLFTPPGINGIIRLHAPWVSESEIENIVEFLKAQKEPEYDEKFLAENIGGGAKESSDSSEELDELYEEAKEIVLSERKTSISYLQRRLQIGYNRAARIVEQLENMGVLSAPNAKGNREILI